MDATLKAAITEALEGNIDGPRLDLAHLGETAQDKFDAYVAAKDITLDPAPLLASEAAYALTFPTMEAYVSARRAGRSFPITRSVRRAVYTFATVEKKYFSLYPY